MILKKLTLKRNKVDISKLGKSSKNYVWWQCDQCGVRSEVRYDYAYLKKCLAESGGHKDICRNCNGGEKYRTQKPLPPEVLIKETIRRFGYDPRNIGEYSNKLVLVKSPKSGEVIEIQRKTLSLSISVLEKGHYTKSIGKRP